jgi:hypothetical protein
MKKADLVPSGQPPEAIRDFGVDLVPDLVPSGQPQEISESISDAQSSRMRFWRRLYSK